MFFPYDLVVVGSGIKIGKWTKGSLKFLKDHKSELANKKVALFVTCGAANDEKTRMEGWENYLIKVAQDNLIKQTRLTWDFLVVYMIPKPNMVFYIN